MLKKIKILFLHCMPQHALSRLMHLLTRIEFKLFKNLLIRVFIRAFHVDMSIAEKENPEDYNSFNDFFTRKLKKNSRKMVIDDDLILSPVDGVPHGSSSVDFYFIDDVDSTVDAVNSVTVVSETRYYVK